jgi:hypothetical protein
VSDILPYELNENIFPFSSVTNCELDCIFDIDKSPDISVKPITTVIEKLNSIMNLTDCSPILYTPYVTTDKLSSSILQNTLLTMLHVNCRSLRKNYNSLINLIDQIGLNIDVIAVTESWLSCNDNMDILSISGYNTEFMNREYNKGGGVLMYINEKYSYQVITNQTFSLKGFMDVLTLEINIKGNNNNNVFVSCVYKSPCVNMKMFIQKFEEFIDFHKGHHSYIIGDLNVDILKHRTSKEINNFFDLMLSNSFHPLINQPTRITKQVGH